MTTTTPENANASSTRDKIVKSPWHESVPDREDTPVKDIWKQQFALISALSEEAPAEENLEEGKVAPDLGNKLLIEKVKKMGEDHSLKNALDYLAAEHDGTTKSAESHYSRQLNFRPIAKKPIDPNTIVQVAQLLCIMDESVYMRFFVPEPDGQV